MRPSTRCRERRLASWIRNRVIKTRWRARLSEKMGFGVEPRVLKSRGKLDPQKRRDDTMFIFTVSTNTWTGLWAFSIRCLEVSCASANAARTFRFAVAQHASFLKSSNDDHASITRSARGSTRAVLTAGKCSATQLSRTPRAWTGDRRHETISYNAGFVTPQWRVQPRSVTGSTLQVCPHFCRQHGNRNQPNFRGFDSLLIF